MNQKTRATLMSFFETGDRPTEEQFRQLIDSMVNKTDDEIYILFPSKNTGIGVPEPKERLDVKGGIRIGGTTKEFPGIIRWNGSDFEGFDGQQWKSLTKDIQASREIFIPEPRVECTADILTAYWEDCTDKRFLDLQPQYWLYRYKSRTPGLTASGSGKFCYGCDTDPIFSRYPSRVRPALPAEDRQPRPIPAIRTGSRMLTRETQNSL